MPRASHEVSVRSVAKALHAHLAFTNAPVCFVSLWCGWHLVSLDRVLSDRVGAGY